MLDSCSRGLFCSKVANCKIKSIYRNLSVTRLFVINKQKSAFLDVRMFILMPSSTFVAFPRTTTCKVRIRFVCHLSPTLYVLTYMRLAASHLCSVCVHTYVQQVFYQSSFVLTGPNLCAGEQHPH